MSGYKKLRRMFIVPIIILITLTTSAQQYPIQVNVNVIPPFSIHLSDYVNGSNKVYVTLTNTSMQSAQSFKLIWSMTGDNGVSVESKPTTSPNNPIRLDPGQSMTLTQAELRIRYEGQYTRDDFNINGLDVDQLLESEILPEGIYTLCARALDFNTNEPLSQDRPMGCSQPIIIEIVDPPQITYPQDEAVVDLEKPQFINFTWIPVNVRNTSIKYRFKMIDITDMQVNPYDAMEGENFLFYKTNILENFLVYDMSKPILEDGHEYAVRVEAYDEQNRIKIKNEGKSDILIFTVNKAGIFQPGVGILDSVPAMIPDTTDGDDTVSSTNTGAEGTGNFQCGGNCEFDLSKIEKTAVSTASANDTILMGHFRIKLLTANWTGDQLNGTGAILPDNFIPVPIVAELKNLKINSNNRVFEGSAGIRVKADSWVNKAWAAKEGAMKVKDILQEGNSLKQIYKNVTSGKNSFENLAGSGKQEAPLGLGPNFLNLQMVGFNLTPKKATINLFGMIKIPDDKDGEKHLSFGAKNLCVNPAGFSLGKDESYLQLLEDVRINISKDYKLELLSGTADKDTATGTYLAFDCDGFREVSANGIVLFSDILIAEDKNGQLQKNDTVAASFYTKFTDWNNWIAKLDFSTIPSKKKSGKVATDRFQYKELEDYTFQVKNAIIDHSSTGNAPGMSFPKNYTGPDKGNPSWQGAMIEQIQLSMPKFFKKSGNSGERITIDARTLLIDATGVTGNFIATDLLNKDEGQLGNWAFSLDSIEVDIVQNSLNFGKLKGGILFPVTDSMSLYRASIDFVNDQTNYSFFIETKDSLNIPMWVAKARLEPNSSVNLDIKGNDVIVKASLNGELALENEVGGIPGIKIKSIKFQNMVLENQPPHLSVGNVGFNNNAETPELLGFGLGMNGLSFKKQQSDGILDLDLNVSFTENQNAISGGTKLRLLSKIDASQTPVKFEFKRAEVDSIRLNADIGVTTLNGFVDMYKDDPKFGQGFEGSLEAELLGAFKVSASALFGNTQFQGEQLKYWYVDGKAISTPPAGIPLVEPVKLFGIGGGAYTNLRQVTADDASELKGSSGGNISGESIRKKYTPAKGILGLKATVVFGLTPEPRTFNGDLGLEVSINKKTYGIQTAKFKGDAYSFAKLTERKNPPVYGGIEITYDNNKSILDADAEFNVNVPPQSPVVHGEGQLDYYNSPGLWYFKAGEPKPENRITVTAGIEDMSITTSAYFMMGQDLPSARLPKTVRNYISGYTPSLSSNSSVSNGNGVAAGIKIDHKFEKEVSIFKIRLQAILGADIAVMDYSNCKCGNRTEFGINKWYANGMGYLYAGAEFQVKNQSVLSTELGSIVEAGLPNPVGVKGILKASVGFMGKEFSVKKEFAIGEICDMKAVEGGEVEVASPFKKVDFISDIKPTNEAQSVDLYTEPVITFNRDVYRKGYSKQLELTVSDGKGGTQTYVYRFNVSISWQKLYEGEWYDMDDWQTSYDRDNMKLTLTAMENLGSLSDPDYQHFMLDGNATYRVKAKVTVEEKKSANYWETVTYGSGDLEGQPISDSLIHRFTTGPTPDFLPPDLISYTVPFDRQRYFTVGDHSKGVIQLNAQLSTIFDSLTEQDYVIKVQFTNMNDRTDLRESEVSMHVATTRLIYDIPELQKESLYKMELIAEKEDNGQSDSGGNEGGWQNNMVNNNQETNFEYTGGENYAEQAQEMAGYLAQAAEAKVLHRIYFGTSKYNTMAEKINAIQPGEAEVKSRTAPNAGVHALSNFNGYDEVSLTLRGGEPFDVFDLQGMAENPQAGIGGPNIDVSDDIDNLPLSTWQRQVHEDVFDDRHFEDANCLGRPPERFDAGIEAFEFEHVNYNNYGYNTYSDWMSTDQTSNILYVDPPLTEDEIESGEASSGNAGFQKPYGSFDITDFSMGSVQTGDESGSSGSENLMPVLEIVYKLDYQAKIIYDRLIEDYYCDEDELPEYPDLSSGEIIIGFKGSGGHFTNQNTEITKELQFNVSP